MNKRIDSVTQTDWDLHIASPEVEQKTQEALKAIGPLKTADVIGALKLAAIAGTPVRAQDIVAELETAILLAAKDQETQGENLLDDPISKV